MRGFNLPRPARIVTADPLPEIPNTGEFYARMDRGEARPTRRFEELEEEERAPELSDEKDAVIKLWVEGLPVTDRETIRDALSKLGNKPIEVSELEVVTERGMIATKSAFFTVNFGENNREKIFYQLENFGLTIKGMRCPVRTAEVKRSLVLIELGQIDEQTLVQALKDHEIPYATYDYPNRYNSPQRQIAFPYRGSVVLTFRSHAEAAETKKMFESQHGVVIGSDRLTAIWGARAGSAPLQIRTSTNYMRNLIWENRDLRKYVTAVRQRNTQLDEPDEFNDLTKSLMSNEQRDLERKRMYEELASKLEEVKLAVTQARDENAGETTEGILRAEELIAEAKEFESDLHMEGVMTSMHQKSVLEETAKTRTLSPHVAKMDSIDALNKLKEMQDTRIRALKEKHHQELAKLKEQFKGQEKLIVREVNTKNHRNASTTAEELGISKVSVHRLTRLKPRKKKIRVRAKKTEEGEESTENVESTENSENAENNENVESTESSESSESSENAENVESSENSENNENVESTESTENAESTESSEANETTEDSESSENTEVSESSESEGKGEEARATETEDKVERDEKEPSERKQEAEDKSNEIKDKI